MTGPKELTQTILVFKHRLNSESQLSSPRMERGTYEYRFGNVLNIPTDNGTNFNTALYGKGPAHDLRGKVRKPVRLMRELIRM